MPAKVKAGKDGRPWHVRLRLKPVSDLITLSDAAEGLGISRQAVHRLVERGTLKAQIIGRGRPIIVVRVKDVLALPMSPQRRRELELRAADGGDTGDDPAQG